MLNVCSGSQPEVSDGHENVGFWVSSGSRFRATGCLLVATSGLTPLKGRPQPLRARRARATPAESRRCLGCGRGNAVLRRERNVLYCSGSVVNMSGYGSDIRVSLTPANLRLSLLVAARSETEHQTLVSVRVTQDGKRIFELPKPLEFRMPAQEIALFSLGGIPVAVEIGKMLDFQVRFDQGQYRSACKLQVREKTS